MTDTRKGDRTGQGGSGHTQDPGRKNAGRHPAGTPEPPAPSPPRHDPTQHPNPPKRGPDHPMPPAGGSGTGSGGGSKSGSGQGGNPNGAKQSAFVWMQHILNTWGLGDLAHYLKGYQQQGLNWQEIQLNLMQTQEWKQRFAGNEQRRKAGLQELNPAQYLAMEESFHQTARQAGIPDGFLDKSVTDHLIGSDVSASEFNDRVGAAAEFVNNTPQVQQAFKDYYGLGKGHAVAAMLDPNRAESAIKNQLTAAEIGGAALENNLTLGKKRAMQFAKVGLSLSSARQAYAGIAQHMSTDESIANRFGQNFGQRAEENAAILGQAGATNRLNTLYADEAAQFGGYGGGANTSSNATAGNY